MVNWVPIVSATLAALPAAAVFFAAYGRYDGAFRDNVVFLYFIGGMVLGGLLGFLTLLLRVASSPIAILGIALLYPIAIVAAANRRKWQGERHAVFNAGAAGLGAAVMISFSIAFFVLVTPMNAAQAAANDAIRAQNLTDTLGRPITAAPPVDSVPYAFTLPLAPQLFLLACGLAGLLFGIGLLAGRGVADRRQFRAAFTGTAILIAPAVFIVGFFRDLREATWVWPALLLAYGTIVAVAAGRKLLPAAAPDGWKRQRRRRERAGAR